jgi:hypothetical protein
MRCEYCGTYLIFRDNMTIIKSSSECPECKASIGTGSFVCTNCGRVLATDSKELSILKAEQKRIQFFHEERLNSIQEVRQELGPTEYVYCVVEGKEGVKYGLKRKIVVTDKRVVVCNESGIFKKTLALQREIPYDVVAGLAYEDELDLNFTLASVRTFNDDERLTITFPLSSSGAQNFRASFETAFENHRLQRKDILSLLCFAKV